MQSSNSKTVQELTVQELELTVQELTVQELELTVQ